MSKTTLAIDVAAKSYPTQDTIELSIGDAAVEPLYSGLSLLQHNAPCRQTLTVRNRWKVSLETASTRSANRTARGLHLATTAHDLAYLLKFLDDYRRSGCAPVDHIDMDFDSPGGATHCLTVILKFPRSWPPVPFEEAIRRLSGE